MGKVYLVGAGPGDPDLLTVRAVRVLGQADVVLHDALVSREVLALVSPYARIVNVGKRCGQNSITQGHINDLLVEFASTAEIVVRLKSGDPSIFGRAGEEIDVLRGYGIEIEIVPGITASLAAAATMSISLTDRRKADQILIVSAHHVRGKDAQDWHKIVNSRTTVVIYMPGDYAGVAEQLRRSGLNKSTPCAIVSKVSSPHEQWHQTTLGLLHDAPRMSSPCVLIVGEAVRAAASEQFRSQIFQSASFQEGLRVPSVMTSSEL